MSQQESMHSLALIRLFELHISRLKQHTIALETNRVLQKKISMTLFIPFLTSAHSVATKTNKRRQWMQQGLHIHLH